MSRIYPGLFKIVICDESHSFKTMDAQRTKAAIPLLKAAKHVILLSGTPALNRPAEIFAQATILKPNLFPSFRSK